ncbi:MAG: N-acetylglucosamine-6-phosphate deacetylase [Aquincola sp.]|nr:N-acetylglucosamine-6-phosphate deacetylase [Aquincola sp.]MDH4287824.1 N-acetylglucosamine-6-phosphate deacetylase [Aquincola sp.]
MSATAIEGYVITPAGLLRGRVVVDGERIVAVEGKTVADDSWRAGDAPVIVPGFIDLHVHGGGGADTMEGGGAIDTIARTHLRHGTTSLLATTMTAPHEEIEAALAALAPACRTRAPGAARVLGVHLEGPYISPDQLGAQPAFATLPSAAGILALHAIAPLRVVTLAPELPGALDVVRALVDEGIRVQLGHSAGTYDDACAALDRGASGFTHLFNAMSALHHRAPGLVGAALAHATHAELIPDLLHVHPGAIAAALRAIPGLYCVTDSTSAAAMPDGDYALGRHRVIKCMGGVRLADGTLAGSTLTMDQALRNLVGPLGLALPQAVRRVSTLAAQYLGESERGVLAPGAFADLAVLDASLRLQRVIVEGEEVALDLAHA